MKTFKKRVFRKSIFVLIIFLVNCAFTEHYEKQVINEGTSWGGVQAYEIFEYTIYSGIMTQQEFDCVYETFKILVAVDTGKS